MSKSNIGILITNGEEFHVAFNSTFTRDEVENFFKDKRFDVATIDDNSIMVYDKDIAKILGTEVNGNSSTIECSEERILSIFDLESINIFF